MNTGAFAFRLGYTISVPRILPNTITSLLLMASYLWGGCVSCDEFFMSQRSKSHCCKAKAQECTKPTGSATERTSRQPAPRDCQALPMGPAGKTVLSGLQSPAHAVVSAELAPSQYYFSRVIRRIDPGPPPEISLRNSSLLI